jgi:glycosyltransferase involved in cell wall biosynthesis
VVDDATLRQILSSADIFFYPSRHEGFGLFPLEAMACGCPVVTTEAIPYASSTPAILTAAIGALGELTAHIQTLVHEEHIRQQLRMLSLEVVKEYDLSTSKIYFSEKLKAIARKTVEA